MSRHATDVIGLQSRLEQMEAKRLRDAIAATKANIEKLRTQYETLTRPVAEAASQ